MSERINELEHELVGIHASNPLAAYNSPSRGVMYGSHFTQHLVTNGLQDRMIYSGVEQEFAKYTFGVRMPANGRIIKTIDKYPPGIGRDSLSMNPETLVIYENTDTGQIDCFVIPYYRSFHQYFGFRCVPAAGMEYLRHAQFIPKDTVFVDTPGVKDGNSYMYGINAKVAYMSIPQVSEDGIAVSESFIERNKFHVFETRTIEWGSNALPVHLYGPNKPFPDIGEFVREDGLLMALRPYEPDTFAVDMGVNDLQQVDYTFDSLTYAKAGRGRVIDIEIIENNNTQRNMPSGMSEQADKYVRAYVDYCKKIIQAETELRMNARNKFGTNSVNISPAFGKMLVRARAITNHGYEKIKQVLKLLYRKDPIDEYYAKFVIEYELTPNIGYKFSNSSGSKGVVCAILPDEDMPTRPDGMRADIVMDPGPVFHRMNIGQEYEQFFTCAAMDVTRRIAHHLGLIPSSSSTDFDNRPEISEEMVMAVDRTVFSQSYEYLMSFYRTFNDTMPNKFAGLEYEEQVEHICDIINDGWCTIYLPINNKRLADDITMDIKEKFEPTMTPVKYKDASGEYVETIESVRIGCVYTFLLDKLADEWSSTAASKLQHFGIVSAVTRSDKFAYPFRNNPTRIVGQTESRIIVCYTGPETMAEMFDRTSNPVTRANIYRNILEAKYPGNITQIIDREKHPLGGSRPIQIVRHIFLCAGFEARYLPEVTETLTQGYENAKESN